MNMVKFYSNQIVWVPLILQKYFLHTTRKGYLRVSWLSKFSACTPLSNGVSNVMYGETIRFLVGTECCLLFSVESLYFLII